MRPIDFNDPSALAAWIRALRTTVLDLAAAGEDATRPFRRRFFSRHEARRRIAQAKGAVISMLDAAPPEGEADSSSTSP